MTRVHGPVDDTDTNGAANAAGSPGIIAQHRRVVQSRT